MDDDGSAEALSPEDNYALDIAGYLVIRGVLSRAETEACNAAIDQVGQTEGMLDWERPHRDPFVNLLEHSTLARYLREICTGDFRLNRYAHLLPEVASADEPLNGGNEPRNWSRSYFQMDQTRFVQGVIAIWALADVDEGDGGFVLVPGTHKSHVETPEDILHGNDDMGLTEQPELKAGDLLLCTETVLHGMRPWKGKARQRLLRFGFIGSHVRRSNGAPPSDTDRDPPAWTEDMTPEQRVIMGIDRPNPGPVVHSDGQKTWVDDGDVGTYHPSIYVRDPDCDIDEKEFYHWDLCGHLVIRGVMDEEWLSAANEAIDAHIEGLERSDGDATHGAESLAGNGLSMLTGLFDFPEPHCEPFRRMIAHPAVVQRMNWMSGSGFVLDCARVIEYEKGTSGHGLHSGPVPGTPRSIYALQNGRTYCETINVTWQLRDANPGDGGFMCIPGSHKCRYELPESIKKLVDDRGLVKHVPMKAGDVVLFMGSAQIHGAYPWMADTPRRGVIANYVSRNLDQPAFRF